MRICHLTLLNPATHTRIFEKEAWSQRKAGFEVTVIGQDSSGESYLKEGIRVIPIPQVLGFSLNRILLQFRVLYLALKEPAEFYVFHSPELFLVGFILSILRRKSKKGKKENTWKML